MIRNCENCLFAQSKQDIFWDHEIIRICEIDNHYIGYPEDAKKASCEKHQFADSDAGKIGKLKEIIVELRFKLLQLENSPNGCYPYKWYSDYLEDCKKEIAKEIDKL